MIDSRQPMEPWPAQRLREARAILADVAHHPDTRVSLAAQVIAVHSTDEAERNEARGMWRVLSTRAANSMDRRGDAA